jgi:DNA polymerase I-like protein with 3'-5' exonuclease and polymerase domains
MRLGVDPVFTPEIKVFSHYEDPNAGSNDQIKDWLNQLGWKPCTYKYVKDKNTGDERRIPQVRKEGELAPSVLALKESVPEIELLEDYTVINHRLGFVKGILKNVDEHGKVRASIAGFTNTLRFRHKEPCSNIPGVASPWGKEIRSLFLSPPGTELVGADMVSLESTTKRHFMQPYDPKYVEEMSQPGFDEHLDLAKVAGRVTQDQIDAYNNGDMTIKPIRTKFKPVNYGCVYGVGKRRLARDTGMSEKEAGELIDIYWERNWAVLEVVNSIEIRKFKNGMMWMLNPVSGFWYSLRYEKDVFSTLNQGTGVFCFDTWNAYLRQRYKVPMIAQFHDENISFTTDREDTTDKYWRACEDLNNHLKLNVPISIDIKYGSCYAHVH